MDRESEMTGTTLSTAAALSQSAPPVARPSVIDAQVPPTDLSESESQASGRGKRQRLRDDPRIPAGLISAILHTVLLLVLALFSYGGGNRGGVAILSRQGEPTPTLTLEAIKARDASLNDQTALAPQSVKLDIAPRATVAVESPLSPLSVVQKIDPELVSSLQLGGISLSASPLMRLPGGGLSGRTPEGRAKWGRKFGATAASEQAVEEALRWIAAHQRPNGSWSFNLELDPCGGRCRNSKKSGDTVTPSTAATGLALLAFLGAGYTHHDGPYAENIRQGIYYLRAVAGETETGYDWQQGSMYGHGIALLALAEAHAMTRKGDRGDSDLNDLVSRGAWFTVVAQHKNGSWGYVPGSPGDTTLTGWQVMSLLAAKRTGAPLGTYTLRDAKEFLLSTSTERDYSFGYQGPPGEPTTTAIGLALMLYLGESPAYSPFYNALTKLSERGPMLTNVYHDYYGTLALHHSRHPNWDLWNAKLRDFLVAKQATAGHEKGSWHFQDKWGDVGGRLYTTAMCAMTLEIYYRYMPLYAEIEEFPL